MPNNLLHSPQPDAYALQHSAKLTHFIQHQIHLAGGAIPFSSYMQYALYAPGLGYYMAGKPKLGAAGDFTTAPQLSPLFGYCLAKHCQTILNETKGGNIIEFGAGTGKLAASLLQGGCQPDTYYIIEISPDLRQQQQMLLKASCPDYFTRIKWLDHLPVTPLKGVIIANEVLDALPASRFLLHNNQVLEYYVGWEDECFKWKLDIPSQIELTESVRKLALTQSPYTSEIHLLLKPWIHSVSNILEQGEILLIDYGFPRRELYHPDRHQGSMMCHYHHHAHTDPFFLPGLQDITAHVDFTAIAEAAIENNLMVAGYTSQAAFLLDCGLLELSKGFEHTQHIKYLTLPSEMGEIFKVIALTREIETPKYGFRLQDRRYQL